MANLTSVSNVIAQRKEHFQEYFSLYQQRMKAQYDNDIQRNLIRPSITFDSFFQTHQCLEYRSHLLFFGIWCEIDSYVLQGLVGVCDHSAFSLHVQSSDSLHYVRELKAFVAERIHTMAWETTNPSFRIIAFCCEHIFDDLRTMVWNGKIHNSLLNQLPADIEWLIEITSTLAVYLLLRTFVVYSSFRPSFIQCLYWMLFQAHEIDPDTFPSFEVPHDYGSIRTLLLRCLVLFQYELTQTNLSVSFGKTASEDVYHIGKLEPVRTLTSNTDTTTVQGEVGYYTLRTDRLRKWIVGQKFIHPQEISDPKEMDPITQTALCSATQDIVQLPCSHRFFPYVFLYRWIYADGKGCCPVCRSTMIVENRAYIIFFKY